MPGRKRKSPLNLMLFLAAGIVSGFCPSAQAADLIPPAADPAAADFMLKCAGCHTVGGGKLTGPDLKDAAAWNPAELMPKIKLMEKKTGPLAPEEILSLAKFLKDPQVADRIRSEQERLSKENEAKYEKGSEKKGAEFFKGQTALRHGGLACVACHRLKSGGGSFGPNLSATFAKMGMTALISACEKAQFREMDAIYRDHPITHQEAIHLAKYLEAESKGPVSPDQAPLNVAAGAFSLCFLSLGAIALYYRRKQPGRPPRPGRG